MPARRDRGDGDGWARVGWGLALLALVLSLRTAAPSPPDARAAKPVAEQPGVARPVAAPADPGLFHSTPVAVRRLPSSRAARLRLLLVALTPALTRPPAAPPPPLDGSPPVGWIPPLAPPPP